MRWMIDRVLEKLHDPFKNPSKGSTATPGWASYRHGGILETLDKWGDDRALLTILFASMTADNSRSSRETIVLQSIIGRSRTFRRQTRDHLDKLTDAVIKDLAENRDKALEKATRNFAVSEARQAAAYLYAMDILYADQGLFPSEAAFAKELADMLKLNLSPPTRVATYNELMKAKNWSGTVMSTNQEIQEKHKAFYTILAAAVLIDGVKSKDEDEELEALMSRTKTLMHFDDATRAKLRDAVVGPLTDSFKADRTRWDLIDWACGELINQDSINKGIYYSAFLHAIDLTLADRMYVKSEHELLEFVANKMGWVVTPWAYKSAPTATPAAPPTFAQSFDVLLAKNAF